MTKRIARDVEDLDGVLKEIVDVLQDDKILNKFNEGSDNSRKYQDVVNFSELGYRYLCLKKDFVGVMNNSEDMGNLMSKIDKNAQPVSEKINYLDFIKESLLLESSPKKDKDVPVVLLVNKGSASASEIVAGALQDAGRAKLVGETTFGKGTVQQIWTFDDGSSLKMTIAEWLTPKSRKIDGTGVTPDILIPSNTQRDDQLIRAVDMLR
jgi:C-terminal peptidase prc